MRKRSLDGGLGLRDLWEDRGIDLGIHLPLMSFRGEGLSLARLREVVDGARECGFAAVSANDHFVFSTPWLDGPTALASVVERCGGIDIATTVSLAVLRGPVMLAKMLAALDIVSGGRLIAALGPGSSQRDYEALGVPFDERWQRFEEAIVVLRALLNGTPRPEQPRYYPFPSDLKLEPPPARTGGIPLWIGSWGSAAGLRRVARVGDGWLASAYNTTPEGFAEARSRLASELDAHGRGSGSFPNALATMWTWVTDDRAEARRVLGEVMGPLLRRDPEKLRQQICVGSPQHCTELLASYREAGCQRVYLWLLGDERRQIELIASDVAARLGSQ
ncbi:MAG: LLM class flavin-dependent oxidoreductase [Solirubrobacterales bacterium]|nr:LLM class flavin-dependent oxidoreductase [Solirubrobacterales bacterium]